MVLWIHPLFIFAIENYLKKQATCLALYEGLDLFILLFLYIISL